MGRRLRIGSDCAGFTLVELLVVIVIIAILAAIAFPVMVKTREMAKTSQCLSNMREIGEAFSMYLDENNDRFPSAVPWGAPRYWQQKGQKTIQELLNPYIRHGMIVEKQDGDTLYLKSGVFVCPSDVGMPTSFGELFGVPANKPVWRYAGCSYEYYASDQEDWLRREVNPVTVPWTGLSPEFYFGNRSERVGAPLSAIVQVTKKAVLGDIYFWHMGDRVPDGRVAWRNTLFADGHAERVRGISHLEARLEQLKHWSP